MGTDGDGIDEATADRNGPEVSQTPPTDDLTFDEAIAEQEDAEFEDLTSEDVASKDAERTE